MHVHGRTNSPVPSIVLLIELKGVSAYSLLNTRKRRVKEKVKAMSLLVPSPSSLAYYPRAVQLEHDSSIALEGTPLDAAQGLGECRAAAAAWADSVFTAAHQGKGGDGSLTKTEIKRCV